MDSDEFEDWDYDELLHQDWDNEFDKGFAAGHDEGREEGLEEGYEAGYAAGVEFQNARLNVVARPLLILFGACTLAGMAILVLITLKVLPWSHRWWGYGLMLGGVLVLWMVGYVLPSSS